MTTLQNEVARRLANYQSVADRLKYTRKSDCLSYLAEDVEFHTERVDEILTIYRARDDARLIGFNLKGLSVVAKNYATFVGITDGKIAFGVLIFAAAGFSKADPDYEAVYNRFRDIVIPADFLSAA